MTRPARAPKSRSTPPADAPPLVFDLASRRMADAIDVIIYDTLVDASRDTGMRVRLKSSQSREARDAAQAFRASLQLDGEGRMTATAIDGLFLAQIVACTESWTGFVQDGAPVACTPENARALYEHPQTEWVYLQVLAAFMDRGRFFANRASNS